MKYLLTADTAAALKRLNMCSSKCVFKAPGLLGCGGFEMQLREWLKEEETANIQVSSVSEWQPVLMDETMFVQDMQKQPKVDLFLSI